VVKTGASLDLCPFIDLSGLALRPVTAAPQTKEANDLAFIASLKEKIHPFSLKDLAPQLGATSQEASPNTICFRYLGQEVVLSKTTLLIDGQEPEDPRDQILLYNYVFGQAKRPPTNDWIGMESLPNSVSKIKTLRTYCENRLANLLAELPEAPIREAINHLGGVTTDNPSAKLAAIVPVLPRLPLCLLFWEAAPEDSFAAQVKVLFDRHVLSILDLESLVFSAERLADRLTHILSH